MTQKTDTKTNADTKLEVIEAGNEAKLTAGKPEKATAKPTDQVTIKRGAAQADAGELPPALIELITELRDTVKRLDPRRHTAKTLRRSLSNVRDILNDIDGLEQTD